MNQMTKDHFRTVEDKTITQQNDQPKPFVYSFAFLKRSEKGKKKTQMAPVCKLGEKAIETIKQLDKPYRGPIK